MTDRVSRVDGKLAYYGKVLPAGPWHDEPDRVEFEHAGFPCLLVRNAAWCGYVAVPPGHPWHGLDYSDVFVLRDDGTEDTPNIHGGLTYSESCGGSVCHVPKPGEPDDVWWLGFDCAHSGDITLYGLLDGERDRFNGHWMESYKTVEYARRETMRLAEQAKEVSP